MTIFEQIVLCTKNTLEYLKIFGRSAQLVKTFGIFKNKLLLGVPIPLAVTNKYDLVLAYHCDLFLRISVGKYLKVSLYVYTFPDFFPACSPQLLLYVYSSFEINFLIKFWSNCYTTTITKGQLFRKDFLVSSNLPKNQRNFCKDFCPSL